MCEVAKDTVKSIVDKALGQIFALPFIKFEVLLHLSNHVVVFLDRVQLSLLLRLFLLQHTSCWMLTCTTNMCYFLNQGCQFLFVKVLLIIVTIGCSFTWQTWCDSTVSLVNHELIRSKINLIVFNTAKTVLVFFTFSLQFF